MFSDNVFKEPVTQFLRRSWLTKFSSVASWEEVIGRWLHQDSCCWQGFVLCEERETGWFSILVSFLLRPVDVLHSLSEREANYFFWNELRKTKVLGLRFQDSKLIALIYLPMVTGLSYLCSNWDFYLVEIVSELVNAEFLAVSTFLGMEKDKKTKPNAQSTQASYGFGSSS